MIAINQCALRVGESCKLVSDLAQVPLPIAKITDSACRYCILQGKHKTVNYVTVGVAISTLHRHGLFNKKKHNYLLNAMEHKNGPGKMLAELLHWIAKPEDGECYCKSRASIMDMWGPDKCEEEIETIVGWLIDGAKKYNIRWVPISMQASVARRFIKEAIRKARKHAEAI